MSPLILMVTKCLKHRFQSHEVIYEMALCPWLNDMSRLSIPGCGSWSHSWSSESMACQTNPEQEFNKSRNSNCNNNGNWNKMNQNRRKITSNKGTKKNKHKPLERCSHGLWHQQLRKSHPGDSLWKSTSICFVISASSACAKDLVHVQDQLGLRFTIATWWFKSSFKELTNKHIPYCSWYIDNKWL